MKFFTLSVVLGEDNTVSVHTDFESVKTEVNTILAESDAKFKAALKAWIEFLFDNSETDVETIDPYCALLARSATEAFVPRRGFLFKNYFVEDNDAFWVIVNCTVHEARPLDNGQMEFLNIAD